MEKWNLEKNVLNADITLNEMLDAIRVMDRLQKKYPNDEYIQTSIEILREEICGMFGGSIYYEHEWKVSK